MGKNGVEKFIFCVLLIVSVLHLANTVFFPNVIAIEETLGEGIDSHTGPLQNNTEIVQTLKLERPISALSFRIATYMQIFEEGQLELEIVDKKTNKTVQSGFWSAEKLIGNAWLRQAGKLDTGEYELKFTTSNFEGQKLLALYTTSTDSENRECSIQGEKQDYSIGLSLAFVEHRYMVSESALFVLVAVLVYSIYKRSRKFILTAVPVVVISSAFCLMEKQISGAFKVSVYYALIVIVCLYTILRLYSSELRSKCKKIGQWLSLRKVRSGILEFIIVVFVSVSLEYCGSRLKGIPVIWHRAFFWTTVFLCITICIHIIKSERNYKLIFVAVAMTGSMLMAVFLQVTPVTWDEQIHYARTVQLSQGTTSYLTEAENAVCNLYISDSYSLAQQKEDREYFDVLHRNGVYIESKSSFSNFYSSIAYFPQCVGMWIGQILRLPFWGEYIMGRLVSAMTFILIVYLSMLRLKSASLILAVIALFPTVIFQTSTYTYDAWVIAMLAFSCACFVGALQSPQEKITTKEINLMLISMILGCSAKAIYGLLALVFLLMPRSKFTNSSEYRKYCMKVCITTVFILLTFIIPIIFSGGLGVGDVRGGSDVNAQEQFLFVLKHPVQYAVILFNFLKGYLALENSGGYISFMAYAGGGVAHVLLMVLLVVVTLTDRSDVDEAYNSVFIKVGSALIIFTVICAIASALYISFTPLMSQTINGCQARYLLPLLFPVAILCGNCSLRIAPKEKSYYAIVYSLTMYGLFGSIWTVIFSQYTL